MKKSILAAFVGVAACLTSYGQISVTWGNSNETYTFSDSAGTELSTGSVILLGTFAQGTDFVTLGNDLGYLQSQFTSFGSSSIGSGGYGELDGYFVQGSNVSALSTPLYYWFFNSADVNAATEWGIVTSTQWTTPAAEPDVLITDLDQVEIPTGVKFGTFAVTEFRTAIAGSAIPEPSSFAALAGLVVVGMVATRRRRSA